MSEATIPVETVALKALKVAAAQSVYLAAPIEARAIVDVAANQLRMQVETYLYAEHLLSDVEPVPFSVPVTVTTEGRRKWYAPWKRHEPVEHRVTARGMVDVEVKHFAAYPEMPHRPALGQPVRLSQIASR